MTIFTCVILKVFRNGEHIIKAEDLNLGKMIKLSWQNSIILRIS